MAEKKAFELYDPLSGVTESHYIDTDAGKFFSRFKANMATCERYAHEKRQKEGKGKGNRFGGVLKGGWKSIGVLPLTIFHAHPEFAGDIPAMIRFLQNEVPKLKTTNAKLC